MLKKIKLKILFFALLVAACNTTVNTDNSYQYLLDFHREHIGDRLYFQMLDSIDTYFYLQSKYGIGAFKHYKNGDQKIYHRSPIICQNSKKNRLAGAILFEGKKQFYVFNYYGYKLKNKWYFFIENTQDIFTKEFLGFKENDIVPPDILVNASNILMEGTIIKNSEGEWSINDTWFENKLQHNGYRSRKDSMSMEEYELASDEFWALKYHKSLNQLRIQLDEKIKENNHTGQSK